MTPRTAPGCSEMPAILTNAALYAGFAVDDLTKAKAFYAETLGGYAVLIYPKPNHAPAEHTTLNFPVDDIEAAVDKLSAAGVKFERYDTGDIKTNEKGIAHPGPWQAWFKDPAGNILSVLQTD